MEHKLFVKSKSKKIFRAKNPENPYSLRLYPYIPYNPYNFLVKIKIRTFWPPCIFNLIRLPDYSIESTSPVNLSDIEECEMFKYFNVTLFNMKAKFDQHVELDLTNLKYFFKGSVREK